VKREKDALAIGVAHGALEGVSPTCRASITDEPRGAGVLRPDFWCWAHAPSPSDTDPACSSPDPEPDRFGFEQAGSALLLEVEAGRSGGPRGHRHYRFRRETLEVRRRSRRPASRASSRRFGGFHPERTLLRLALRGSVDAEAMQRTRAQVDG